MKVYTYTEARQKLAALLDLARREGAVQIRRRDGQLFLLQPVTQMGSPLDVPGVEANLRRGESLDWLRAAREKSANGPLDRGPSAKQTQSARGRQKSTRTRKTPSARPRS